MTLRHGSEFAPCFKVIKIGREVVSDDTVGIASDGCSAIPEDARVAFKQRPCFLGDVDCTAIILVDDHRCEIGFLVFSEIRSTLFYTDTLCLGSDAVVG